MMRRHPISIPVRRPRRRALGALFGLTLALPTLAGCAIATPFRTSETASSEAGETAIVAITQAELGDDAQLRRAFWRNVDRVEASLARQPGFLGVSMRRRLLGDVAWTMTAWADEESLNAFVASAVHQRAIAEAFGGLAEAQFVRFEVARTDLPVDWSTALERLEAGGRGY